MLRGVGSIVGHLHLKLLGGFAAQAADGRVIKLSNRRNQALLGFLALSPGQRHGRDKLVALLWGERDNDQGRHSLRQGLAVLRKELTEADPAINFVAGDGEQLFVPADAIEVDALAFERLARAEGVAELRAAADLYRGALFAAFGLREPGFEEWLRSEQVRLRELAIDVFTRLIPHLDGTEAVETARRLVDFDPLREGSQRLLIGALLGHDQTALALEQFRNYGAMLERELGIKPSDAMQALGREIEGGRRRRPSEHHPADAQKDDHRLAERPLIAVLPFVNRSLESGHQAFCEAMTDEVADAISRVASFLVVSGPAIAAYRSPTVDVRAVGADLNAAYVLQGSVYRHGDRMRISVQLSDAANGHHVWVEQYDGAAEEILEIQETIIRAIAASTETHIMLAVRDLATRDVASRTFDALATRANSLLYDETQEALDEILELAERAVELAPRDFRAHQLMAEAAVQRLATRIDAFDIATVERALTLARVAVGMAPNNEWAHLVLARAYAEADDFEAAIAEAERALAINPSSAVADSRLGECYALLGRTAEAIESTQLAMTLDPRGPESYRRHFTLGLAQFAAGNDAEAMREAGHAARWRPDYTRASLLVAASAASLDLKPEAEAAVARCLERYPDLRADQAVPRVMPPFRRPADRERLVTLLRAAGLPG